MEELLGPNFIAMLTLACAIGAIAGAVKGAVGFGLPIIMMSGLSTVMHPELALAGLIIPALVTNWWQALRSGFGKTLGTMRAFRPFLLTGLVFLVTAAQLVRILPLPALLLALGVPVSIYAAASLAGRSPRMRRNPGPAAKAGAGAVAGFFGGLAGVWGPATVALLSAMDLGKTETMRIQGVIYGLGAAAMTLSHIGSGVLNASTVWFSAAMLPPTLLGMWLGLLLHDRINRRTFWTLMMIALLLAGLNLIRRAMMGA